MDPFGSIYIAGHYSGEITFERASYTAKDPSATSPFIAKFDTTGIATWMKAGETAGFSNFYDITTDSDAQVYVLGNFVDNITFDGIPYGSQPASNGLVMQLASNGTVNWLKEVGGTGDSEFLTHVNITAQGLLHFGGQATSDSLFYDGKLVIPAPSKFPWLLFTADMMGNLSADPSEDELFAYASALNSVDNLIIGDNIGNNDILIQHVDFATRPKPIERFTVDNTLFIESTVGRTHYDPLYTYQWYRNGVALQGEAADTINITQNGRYKVEVNNGLGCFKMSGKY